MSDKLKQENKIGNIIADEMLKDGNKHLFNTIDNFNEEARSQEVKGINKYGKSLDPLDNYDWLEMASEELVDAYKYFHAERVKRDDVVKKIKEKVREINELVEWLEGGEV